MKKKRLAIAGIVLLVIGLAIFLVRCPRSYKTVYNNGDYEVTESYDKAYGYYKFQVTVEDEKYSVLVLNKYIHKRKLVDEVDVLAEDDEFCVFMKSDTLETYPVCRRDGEWVDYDLLENRSDEFFKRESPAKIDENYQGIEIENILGKNYFIWNYRGYYFINDKTREEINLLEKESYYNNLAYSNGEYLITPNYDQDYVFTEFYVINMKNGKVSTWRLDDEISYNSYFLGDRDGLIYLVDRKNKAEYELDPKKKRVERVDKNGVGKVYDDKWTDVSMTKLSGDDFAFEAETVFDYRLVDGDLNVIIKDANEMRVSEKKVDKIISNNDDSVFYLVGDELYSFSLKYGENLVFKYSELNFNNLNSIFIY